MVPQTKVFVGSLPQGSKPEELRKLFERFGVVTECDIMNRCGFVHMQTEEQASAAIRALHNTTFNGGVISVERGRIKERGARGGGGGRGRGRGGPLRGYGGGREAPYAREPRPGPHLRPIPPAPGYAPRTNMAYDRAPPAAPYDDRYYGGEDRRGFALVDAREPYPPAPMYEDRRGYMEELPPVYEERRPHMYEDMDMMHDRRGMGRAPPPYERAPPRPAPITNGDMYSRRSPMRGAAPVGGYDRDPYAQQYPPMGRGGGAPARSGGMGPRRY